jgi:ABC-type multidrug transport system fused ATPase/permease subunit
MKHILKYLKEFKKESILAPLFKMLEALFDLFIPLVVASMINKGINGSEGGSVGHVLLMGGIMVALGLIGLACSVTAQFFAARAAVGVSTRMREDLFAHINKLSHAELDTIGTSTLITRMTSDVNQIQNGVNLVLRLFLRSPFIVLGALIMAFVVSPRAGLVFLITIPILAVIVFGIMKASIPMYTVVQQLLDKVLGTTRENLIGVRVVRAFCRQKDEMEEFDAESEALRKQQMRVGNLSAAMNPLTYVVVNLGIAAILLVGSYQVQDGSLKNGDVVALVNYMSQVLVELIKLANLIITVTKSLACAKRVEEIFDQQPSVVQEHQFMIPAVPGSPKIEFKDVSFTYKNAKEPSLEHISFSVYHGETIGIIGSTGSGKTSLVNMIPRFYDTTEGKVLVDGRDVREYSFGQLRNKIGIVPQKAVLFKGTIRDNMKWGRAIASDKDIYKALEIAQARDFVDAKKEGLDFKVAQGGRNLSGGQRQRLTIARALVKKPEIMILDDSSSALDYATDAKLRDALEYQTQGATTLIVSQRAASIMHADRIIVMEDGKIAGIGSHEELLQDCEVYKEICMSQLSKEELGA